VTPLSQIAAWIDEARAAGTREPDAMTLATATPGGVPSARVVLCRGIDERGLRFFTSYESRKSRELAENAHVAAVFHWDSLARQARVEGTVERLAAGDSDAYFAGRPRGSQLAAWASPQSAPIESLDVLHARVRELDAKWAGQDVPRPPSWGGFLILPRAIELWVAGSNRLHDRMRYERVGGTWVGQRLGP
jgi:pyridoxamine 5'-phosphate oxidase